MTNAHPSSSEWCHARTPIFTQDVGSVIRVAVIDLAVTRLSRGLRKLCLHNGQMKRLVNVTLIKLEDALRSLCEEKYERNIHVNPQ